MANIRQDEANREFGTAVIYAIATDPRLADLAKTFVLKGGAALLLGYGSGRATRRDLDFDVRTKMTVTDRHVTDLFDALRPWRAQYDPNGRLQAHTGGFNIGPIAFMDPRPGRGANLIKIQVSHRRLPPTLHKYIALIDQIDPLSNRLFKFPMMSLEGISAEKVVRSFKTKLESGAPAGAVSVTDMYDVGFIRERGGDHLLFGELRTAFNLLCAQEAADEIVLTQGRLDALALRVYAARDLGGLFGDPKVVDQMVTFQTARKRVLAGIVFTKQLAGLESALPKEPQAKR
jgi:hypothetical protein